MTTLRGSAVFFIYSRFRNWGYKRGEGSHSRAHSHVTKGLYCLGTPLEMKFSIVIKCDSSQAKAQMTFLGLLFTIIKYF